MRFTRDLLRPTSGVGNDDILSTEPHTQGKLVALTIIDTFASACFNALARVVSVPQPDGQESVLKIMDTKEQARLTIKATMIAIGVEYVSMWSPAIVDNMVTYHKLRLIKENSARRHESTSTSMVSPSIRGRRLSFRHDAITLRKVTHGNSGDGRNGPRLSLRWMTR